LFAEAVGEQAIAADAHEALGQYMQEKAAEEVHGVEGHDALLAAVGIIAPEETDTLPVEAGDPVIADGHAMGVAAEGAQHMFGSPEGRLGVDVPSLVAELVDQLLERRRIAESSGGTSQVKQALAVEMTESGEELLSQGSASGSDPPNGSLMSAAEFCQTLYMCPLCLIGIVILLHFLIPAEAAAQMQMSAPQGQSGQQQQSQKHERLRMQTKLAEMPGMQMPMDLSSAFLMDESSGTSVQPRGWDMPMVMTHIGEWQLSWMGQAFIVDVQQSHVYTPPGTLRRGGDKLYSTNWGMLGAQHSLAGGTVMLRTMMSLEPATITGRRYPELFQFGETAFGQPIVDGQHPHNLFMEIGTQFAHPIGKAMLNFYYAPVGDPALGPTAYPHRASAAEIPQATLGHHYEDSTHIADNVATADVAWHSVHIEAGGFYGREPGENRWTLEFGPMDSWTSRVTWLPARNWQAQLSTGRLRHPEAPSTGDEERTTASIEYVAGERAGTLAWGRDYKTEGHYAVNAITAEGLLPIKRKNYLTGRFEWSQRDELFADQPALESTLPRWFDISAYTAGYTREIGSWHDANIGIGANATAYGMDTPARAVLINVYGDHPRGYSLFVRLRLKTPINAAVMH